MPMKLTQLGHAVKQPTSPQAAVLEAVPNPHIGSDYVIRFTAPEFTTLCPITGQPDFAHFVIDYVPGKSIVESKSLKLFLTSFRNASGFHEDTSLTIGKRIAAAIKPRFIRVAGYWYPRGGMPIDIFWQSGKLPSGVWLPETGVAPYRGRG
jgi:7-cyano-7-deazaguanine reductase